MARVLVRSPLGSDSKPLAAAWFRSELRSLEDAYPDGFPPQWFWMTDVEQVEERWVEGMLMDPTGQTWVADLNGEPVGFSQAGPSPSDERLGVLRSLYVDPEAWGSGAGSALHDVALAALASFGSAELWVIEGNARTRRFYEKRGWNDAMASTRTPNGLPLVRYTRAFQ